MSGRTIGTVAGLAIGVAVAVATGGTSAPTIGLFGSIGATLGGLAGTLYDSAHTKFDDVVNRQERLADLSIQTSTLGIPIPQIWGKIGGLAGNVIWATAKVPHENREVIEAEGGGGALGKGGPSGPRQVNITITYTQSYALGLCDTRLSGPIAGLSKIWQNSNLYWDRAQNGATLPDGWTFYDGDPTQSPDPTIEADKGAGNVPRYPYLCYVVVADDDQGRSGQTPVYTFEVLQSGAGTTRLSTVAVSPVTAKVFVTAPTVDDLARYHPTTRVRETVSDLTDGVPSAVFMSPLAIESGSGEVWTASLAARPQANPYSVLRLDSVGALLNTYELAELPASNIVFSGGDAWIATYVTTTLVGTVRRLTSAGSITTVSLSGDTTAIPRLAVGADGHVWIANNLAANAKRINPATDTVIATVTSLGGCLDLAVGADGHIWVIDREGDVVRRINPATDTVVATVTVGAFPVAVAVATDGYLWVGNAQGHSVTRINPADNSTQTYPVGALSRTSAFESIFAQAPSGAMWVLCRDSNTAVLVSTAGVTTSLKTAMQPVDIAQGASNTVWVTSLAGGNLQQLSADGTVLGIVTGNDLPTIVTTLCAAVGLTAIEVTDLPGDLVSMVLLNVEAARVPLEQLAHAYRFYAVESGAVLKFRERGSGGLVFALTDEELGAGDGQADETGLRVERAQEADLPTSVEVQYVDPDQNYQRNTQPGQLALPASGVENARSVNVGSVVLTADSARQLATELAVEAWVARETLSTTVRRKYAALEPGDRGTITARGLTYTAVLTETSYGAPGLVELSARVDAGYIRNAIIAVPGVVVPMPQTPTTIVGDTTVLLLNLYALSGSDQDARYHVAYSGETEPWEGGGLYRSTDGGTSYGLLDAAALEGITGTVAVATANADYHVLDTSSSISVVLEYGSLSSISDIQLYNGGNLCAIGNETNGWEILGFGVATLTATRTYTLTRLLRGRRGTEFEVSGHGVNETFVRLDAGLRTIGMALADRHVVRPYKSVTAGQAIADVTAVTFTPTASNLNSWSVAQPDAVASGSDWSLTWRYRSRFQRRLGRWWGDRV